LIASEFSLNREQNKCQGDKYCHGIYNLLIILYYLYFQRFKSIPFYQKTGSLNCHFDKAIITAALWDKHLI
jgi:hypothetical protein